MTALRQLLNAKELTGSLYPRALPEESRQMAKQKMEAMGYPISPPAVPVKEPALTTKDDSAQNLRPVKYNKEEPLSRSYEDYDRSIYTSIYEERLSQDLTPTLNINNLPYRAGPNRNNSETHLNSKQAYNQRRRSRSVSQEKTDSSNPWDKYNASQGLKPSRRDSGRSISQPPTQLNEGSGSMQTLQDRQRTPQPNTSGFEPLSKIGQKKREAKKNSDSSFDPMGSNSSRTTAGSVGSGIKHTIPPLDRSNRKRSRDADDLDYPPAQLESMTYSELANEPFDHNPPSFFSENSLTKRLPTTTLSLSSRLQAVYDTSTSRAALAKTLFASMPIDTYDECGDMILGKFSDLVERLKQARRAKRRACIAMEEEVAIRERWVRKKRSCVEDGLGQLRTTGMSVIRPRPGNKI